jgi:predicted Rossmann-fold nucleotide-binding protein
MRLTIYSGGQTGVDRAALDIALELGLPCGGWCPRGRRAEDGTIPDCYPLKETKSGDYPQRTEWNIRDSDATLVLTWGASTGGTALAIELAEVYRRAYRVVDLTGNADPEATRAWLSAHAIRTLNVAGPRASVDPSLYVRAASFLREVLTGQPGAS